MPSLNEMTEQRSLAMSHSHPVIAAIYDRMCAAQERAFLADLRRKIVGRAIGRVVEVGAGTGLNFSHYQSDAVGQLVAVEPDSHMRRRAVPRAAEVRFPLEFIEAPAERLPFDTGFADTVVATLVLCSVDDPEQAARELHRVLKPAGTFLFIEHVRSDDGWRASLQDWITPWWKHLAGNCHANRASLAVLRTAGFDVQELHRVPRGGPWGNPIVAGVATK
jgi:ubiquinone/menaquinone biosynthesis C-methylase UbiE